MRLWIDTDVGTDPDDAFALLCAAGHPDVELVGVSTVDGDVEWRAIIARRLVAAPVVVGPDLTPAFEAARPDALLAIGPLTNIARIAGDEVVLPPLTLMGGLLCPIDYRGSHYEIEHNFGADSLAARAVVSAGLRPTICPLDVTARMRVPDDRLVDYLSAAPILEGQCAAWPAPLRLHDPLAFLALMGEPVVSTRIARLAVDHDGRVTESHEGHECVLVDDVDVTAAMDRIHELIARSPVSPQ